MDGRPNPVEKSYYSLETILVPSSLFRTFRDRIVVSLSRVSSVLDEMLPRRKFCKSKKGELGTWAFVI